MRCTSGLLRLDRSADLLDDRGLARLRRRHDQPALALPDRRDQVDDARRHVARVVLDLEAQHLVGEQRREVLEAGPLTRGLGIGPVDRVDAKQRRVPLVASGGPARTRDVVALAQTEPTHLLHRHVHVVTAREVAADAQEPVALVAQVEQPVDLDGLTEERLLLAALPVALAVTALTVTALTVTALAIAALTVAALTVAALTVAVTVAAPTTAAAVAGLALVLSSAPVLVAVAISSIAVPLAGRGRVGRGRLSSLAIAGFRRWRRRPRRARLPTRPAAPRLRPRHHRSPQVRTLLPTPSPCSMPSGWLTGRTPASWPAPRRRTARGPHRSAPGFGRRSQPSSCGTRPSHRAPPRSSAGRRGLFLRVPSVREPRMTPRSWAPSFVGSGERRLSRPPRVLWSLGEVVLDYRPPPKHLAQERAKRLPPKASGGFQPTALRSAEERSSR